MDVEGDVHTVARCSGRGVRTAKRARKALAGPGVVVRTARANKDSGQVYPGYGPEVNPEVNTEKRVQGPTHA